MLHKINLLPWRDTQREQHKRRFVSLLVLGVLFAVSLQWLAGSYLSKQNQQQQSRLIYLSAYINQLDQRIHSLKQVEGEHKALLTRLDVVEHLQSQRNKTTQFMNAIPDLVPAGVYVDKIKMNGGRIEMSGISDTTSRLATMLDKLETSPSMTDIEMHSIVHGKARFGKKFQTFNVSFSFDPSLDLERNTEESTRG